MACSHLIELVRTRAADRPGAEAFIFLKDGESEAGRRTLGDLDERAWAIAALLQRRTLVEKRVPLLDPPGLEFIDAFLGCL